MKNCLKKILIVLMAVVCAFSIHITVNAQEEAPNNWGSIEELINQLIGKLEPEKTTTAPDTTTAQDPNATTTTDQNTTTDPVASTVTGTATTVPATVYPTVDTNNNNNNLNNNNGNGNLTPGELTTVPLPTTEPFGEEDESNGSLADLLEQDSAAIIVQAPTEKFTLNTGLVVNDGTRKEEFTWQQAALVAAAVLFVILAALVGALIVQRSKRIKEEEEERRRINNMAASSHSAPVPVEVMTPERIAELLGSAPNTRGGYNVHASAHADIHNMSSEESASAIKAAILMSQLSQSYSDPLIRKYTEEPVMFSPVSKVSLDDAVTGAQILEATDLMLKDITGTEKYATDIRGMRYGNEDIDSILGNTESKVCPECRGAVEAGDMFCHSCGAYVG